MQTIIDIFNNILKYDTSDIYVILDTNGIPWFLGSACAQLLKYSDTNRAIRTHVNKKYKTHLANLIRFMKHKPIDVPLNSIYINEFGLYSLLLSSRKEQAKPFKRWIINQVIPSIRKTNMYTVEDKYREKIIKLEAKIKEKTELIHILKHNQTGGGINSETLVEIPVIESATMDKYCKINFHPIFDYRNIPLYLCKIEQIKKAFIDCDESFDDEFIDKLKIKGDLSESNTVLLHIVSNQAGGGIKYMPSDEFNEKITVLEDRMILPNGFILLKSGKVIAPG